MGGRDADCNDALWNWATSGAMALTGRVDGPPLAAPGDPAGLVTRGLERIGDLALERTGRRPTLPGSQVLGERAAIAGFRRAAPTSCGGSFEFLPTRDGFLGLTLARPEDVALVPALVQRELAAREGVWAAVRAWAVETSTEMAVARVRLLGLPGAAIPSPADGPVRRVSTDIPITAGAELASHGGRRAVVDRPLVLDFTSLWAGPLSAHLLGLGGARVVKIESPARPDGARRGPPAFFNLLHAGHEAVSVDPSSERERAALLDLVLRADLVLEASRPRALRGWGLVAEDIVAHGTNWLSITARGRGSDSVGFGDDVAAEAGLIAWEGGAPRLCGDALADPLAGVIAAVGASEALAADTAALIDLSMLDVARAAASMPGPVAHEVIAIGDRWFALADGRRVEVLEPRGRAADGRAPELGEHNSRYL